MKFNLEKIYIKFEDEKEGIIDLTQLVQFTGIFERLKDLNYFQSVKLNPEWGTIYWENGADLDPDVLYSIVTGETIYPRQTGTLILGYIDH